MGRLHQVFQCQPVGNNSGKLADGWTKNVWNPLKGWGEGRKGLVMAEARAVSMGLATNKVSFKSLQQNRPIQGLQIREMRYLPHPR